MNLKDFFDKHNIDIDIDKYEISFIDYDFSEDNIHVSEEKCSLSDSVECFENQCEDFFGNIHNCLFIYFATTAEPIYSSIDKLQHELEKIGYRLVILNHYSEVLDVNDEKVDKINNYHLFSLELNIPTYKFVSQFNDSVIYIIDDEKLPKYSGGKHNNYFYRIVNINDKSLENEIYKKIDKIFN